MSSTVKSVVLLSGGLDSSVNLLEAQAVSQVVTAITFVYGQRAQLREVESAARQCKRLGIAHKVVEMNWFADFTRTALVDRAVSVPMGVDLSSGEVTESARQVWVPNRNGVFLNIAAAYAEGMGAAWIVPGFNREEAVTFPDNGDAFIKTLNESFKYSTQSQVQVRCFTTHLDKFEIAKRGLELGLVWEELWPCYLGEAKWCGTCESCLRFRRATEKAGIKLQGAFKN